MKLGRGHHILVADFGCGTGDVVMYKLLARTHSKVPRPKTGQLARNGGISETPLGILRVSPLPDACHAAWLSSSPVDQKASGIGEI